MKLKFDWLILANQIEAWNKIVSAQNVEILVSVRNN